MANAKGHWKMAMGSLVASDQIKVAVVLGYDEQGNCVITITTYNG